MIKTVNTSAQLSSALQSATAGDVIQLEAGVYSGAINGLHFTSDVTITSANLNNPAILTTLSVSGSSGLSFSHLELVANAGGGDNPFRVTDSQDVHFDSLKVHGSLDGNPQNDVAAFLFQRDADVSITGSEFSQLSRGISHFDSSGLVISGNQFHDLRLDGVAGGGSSNVTISQNQFSNFFPLAADHPDAIQFWTVNTTASAHDITISGNSYVRGTGQPIQGVFLRDEVGGLPFRNVTITNNLISGGLYHGISVLGGANVTASGNVVQGFADYKSWIMYLDVNGGSVTGNSVNEYVNQGGVTGVQVAGNTVLPLATDGGAAALQLWKSLTSPATNQPTAGNDNLVAAPGFLEVHAGAGNDTVAGAASADYLRGDDGDDSIAGGSAFDDANGNLGADTISTGAGDDYCVGGKDNDLLFGDGGGDIVWGNLGADTCNGGDGNDQVRGGQGDDSVAGGAGADFVSGDRGNDTVTGGLGADIFHGSQDAGVDRVLDFSVAQGDRVQLDPGTVYTIGQVGADTVLDMGGGHQMILAGVSMSSLTATTIFLG